MNTSNNQLVDAMIESTALRASTIIAALRTIDRIDFVNTHTDLEDVYEDRPLPIGWGQTISQPSTVAFMLELLAVKEGECVLDVGSGSGWTTALLGYIVGEEGSVDGVEIVPELVTYSCDNVAKYELPWAYIHEVKSMYGYPEKAPYDKILVSAAGLDIPQELVAQLRIGGKMVLPVKNDIVVVTREEEGRNTITKYYGFSFVPLIKP